jgi:hypothetical protein
MSENDKNTRQELMDSFQGKSAQELSELLADLTLNYVVRQRRPAVDQLAMMPVPDELRELNFSELVVVLQSQLGLDELRCFSVNDGVVTVRWGEHQLIMADNAQNQTSQSQSTAPASSPAPSGPSSSRPTPAPTQTEAKKSDTAGADASDRFSMLEID